VAQHCFLHTTLDLTNAGAAPSTARGVWALPPPRSATAPCLYRTRRATCHLLLRPPVCCFCVFKRLSPGQGRRGGTKRAFLFWRSPLSPDWFMDWTSALVDVCCSHISYAATRNVSCTARQRLLLLAALSASSLGAAWR